jgi:GT2 family glycosyltransferase
MNTAGSSLAVGMVIYAPPADLFARLEMLDARGLRTYIYDNSPANPMTRSRVGLLKNAIYLTSGANRGLGVGLSVICATAYDDRFGALLFFDQDTIFDESTIGFIQNFMNGPALQCRSKYSAIVFASNASTTPSTREAHGVEDVMMAISSGSLFFLENLKKIGWHNETYFVDGVDYEFCLRSLACGLKIGRCSNTPGFDHVSGQPDRLIKILGKTLPLRRYSAERMLDTFRSHTRLLCSSLRMRQFRFAAQMIRTVCIYVLGRLLAWIVLK